MDNLDTKYKSLVDRVVKGYKKKSRTVTLSQTDVNEIVRKLEDLKDSANDLLTSWERKKDEYNSIQPDSFIRVFPRYLETWIDDLLKYINDWKEIKLK